MATIETQTIAVKALETECNMAERAYHLEDDGTLDTIVGCNSCSWTGRYNPDMDDGLDDSPHVGPVPYSNEEINLHRIIGAYAMASEDHHH